MPQKTSDRRLRLTDQDTDLLMKDCQSNLRALEHELTGIVQGHSSISIAVEHRILRGFRVIKTAASLMEHPALVKLSCAAANAITASINSGARLSDRTAGILLLVVNRLEQMIRRDKGLSGNADDLIRILKTKIPRQSSSARQGTLAQRGDHQDRMARRSKLRILLVEDDFTSRVMLQGLLLPYGNCHVAVNGREAVEAFRAVFATSGQYDLICMDVRMPEMNGTEAVRQIRAIEEAQGILSSSGVKIFMTTAICDLKTVNSSYGSLCDAYLLKPIDGVQLKQHLEDFRLLSAPAHRRESVHR